MSSQAKKIVDYTINDVIAVIFVFYILGCVINFVGNIIMPTDDTDGGKFHRSGVSVITDHATGREYLETPQGFLTPRLRSDIPVNVNKQYFSPVTVTNGDNK